MARNFDIKFGETISVGGGTPGESVDWASCSLKFEGFVFDGGGGVEEGQVG